MKSSTTTALGIFVLVIIGGAVSAGVFVVFGSQFGVYAAIALAPMLLIIGGLWIRQKANSAGTNQEQYTRRRAQEVGEAFVKAWEKREQMRQTYPNIVGNGLGLGIDALISDLNEAGIQFDRSSGAFTLASVTTLEGINSLGTRVESLDDELEQSFGDAVSYRIGAIEAELNRLDDLTSADLPAASAVPQEDWQGAGDMIENARTEAVRAVDEAAETIQSAIGAAEGVQRTEVEDLLAQARTAADNYQFAQAVTTLLDARDAVRRKGQTTFDATKRNLQSLLDTVATKNLEEYLSDNSSADVAEIQREVNDLDDAMELSALSTYRQSARERCLDIVTSLETELDNVVRQLEQADIPDGYYAVPEVYERDYANELRNADNLSEFESLWETAVDELTAALDELQPKADVVSGYERVREQIEATLRSEGRVEADDLPVRKHEEQFLGLYYRENPNSVTFDIDEPSLTAAGGRDSFDVEVTVKFEYGGPDRQVVVHLDGDEYDDTKTVTTPLVGTTTFADVPFGQYRVRAEPESDEFDTAEQTVQVKDDMELELELQEITLQDRVCEGIRDDAERYLDDLEATLSERFDTEGYLSTSMSYRVDDEYLPCLLVLWADQTPYTVTDLADRTILVYDADTTSREIENVITYNLEAGEAIDFDDLREKYLSAPVPDEVIADIVSDLDSATVDETETRLVKS